MKQATHELLTAFPEQTFAAGNDFVYDSADDIVYYDSDNLHSDTGRLSLLHEIAHARLAHFHYTSDLELFIMETKAWALTRQLADQYAVAIDDDYIDDCLQSYANWLEQRATCPLCDNFSLQQGHSTYRCFRCGTRWRVYTDALERIRRQRIDYEKASA